MSKVEKIKKLTDFWYEPWGAGKSSRWESFTNLPYNETSFLTLINYIMASVDDCDWSVLGD